MLKIIQVKLLIIFILIISVNDSFSQNKIVVDKIVATVGNSIILKSDIHNHKMQYKAQNVDLGTNPFCTVLEELIYQKLLYNQAIIDSVEISEDRVEAELNRRLRFFIQKIGSRERLEEYYGMTVEEIKDDFRDIIHEQKLSQAVESKITSDVRVTPSEVKHYFNNLSEDDIPVIESRIQLSHIVKKPPIREEEIQNVKRRLNEFRDRIIEGEDFSTLAIMYSDDNESARKGGELGFTNRGELHPEFEAVVFDLQPNEVSEVFETKFGYHIAQKIERRGEQINVRHILLIPKPDPHHIKKTQNKLDSIRRLVMKEEMTFGEAAEKFSDDPSRINEGVIINPNDRTTNFKPDELDSQLFFAVDRMEVGSISRHVSMITEDGKQAFRIIQLNNRTKPSKANLRNNYDHIHQIVLKKKKRKKIEKWIKDIIKTTYFHVKEEEYTDCDFSKNWVEKHLTTSE